MADTPDFSPVIARNAEWASRFGGSSTNAAQRQRYAQDQAAQADQLLQARAAAQYSQAQTNKTAQDFYFRQQEMNRKEAMDKATLDIRHQQQANKDELVPAQIEATKARAAAQSALETARINRESRQAQNAARVATDTDQFEQKQNDLLDSAKPGSQAFADATLKNIAAHPFVSSDLRKTWLGQAGIKNDPDQLMRDTAQFQDTHNTTLTRDSKGQWEVKLTPKPVVAPRGGAVDPMQKRLASLESLRSKANLDTDQKAYLDDEITKARSAISTRLTATQPAPATDTTGTSAPGAGATGDTGTTGDTSTPASDPAATPAVPTSFVSPASFPAGSDFHDIAKIGAFSPQTFVPHTVEGYPLIAGSVMGNDGNIRTYDKEGNQLASVEQGSLNFPGVQAARTAGAQQYDALHSTADDAIKAGASPDAVKARLQQMGGDPARLTYDD